MFNEKEQKILETAHKNERINVEADNARQHYMGPNFHGTKCEKRSLKDWTPDGLKKVQVPSSLFWE